ncbi:hypothetical protein [Pseudoxanthomonas sacheonensis]|uniref:Uncharacterized protein n=1 Tax=Pseudoxanthomonas sacheonensis TaxID=443615 RepID=A0ABU1RRZ7_9GAMM|nr:hypothetical protein [Pseudoxanthomonas sacheonensis]MDR6841551.1 hypothetical protein [Pseudoxanthomonas sacheonensis]
MAAKRKPVTRADHDRLFFTRWVLFLLVANEAAGLPKVSRQRLHALLFMSFASSRYYAIEPLRQRARRTQQGPYYRNAHVALGGLVLGGMVSVEDFMAHPAPRDLQFEGVFRPTLTGLDVAQTMRETVTGARLYRFLLDMCLASAYTTNPHNGDTDATLEPGIKREGILLDNILGEDLTYRRAVRRYGDILELQDAPDEQTPTVAGLSSIEECLEQQGAYNRKDVVAAYQTLLMRRSRKAA